MNKQAPFRAGVSALAVLAVAVLGMGCSSTPPAPGNPGDPDNLYTRGAQGKNGVVASAKVEASKVGIDVLKQGGNAVDAAVAMGFAIGVVEPNTSGLGGGGFMVIKLADMSEAVVLDFRETAPAKASPTMYLDAAGKVIPDSTVHGGLSVGTPGDVAGLLYALDNYGSKKLTRAQVMNPAIKLAEGGFKVTKNFHGIIEDDLAVINTYPATSAIYTDDGLPPDVGTTIKNPDLGKSLRTIAAGGRDAFYKGPMAEATAKAVQDAGGILTVEDLAGYQVQVRKPVIGTYRGYTILSTPPASSGGTHVVQILNMLENTDVGASSFDSPETVQNWIQALRLAFADRGKYMADTAFTTVPLSGLTSKDYAKALYAKFDAKKAMLSASPDDPAKYQSGSTTSFSVMDKAGNMVAVTKTINYFFGSGVTVPGYGFIMNDEMDDFVATPGSANSVEPGKRPLSSMTPTLVLAPDGTSFMTLGSPGATRIIAAVAEVISNILDHGMDIQSAISAPRYFTTASGQVHFEGRIPSATTDALKAMGYDINIHSAYDPYFGGAQAVMMDAKTKTLHGGGDPRRDGQAVGY
jgi:gamma-glutamyltranspeptidase/glutathione hydrolase